jgi:hypothetical protein
MLSLSRSRATGVLSVRSDSAVCGFTFVDGALRAATEEHAQHELRECVREVFRWRRHELRFEPGLSERFGRLPIATSATESFGLSGMRAAVAKAARLAPEPDASATSLTAWGRNLLDAGAQSDAERSLADALQRRAAVSDLLEVARSSDAAYRTWVALSAFGALAPEPDTRMHYALLLRKRAQVRRRANALELLDLEPGRHSRDAPRRALRRLAARLHPDRLGPDAPESARALSHEVMQALTRAAFSLERSRV